MRREFAVPKSREKAFQKPGTAPTLSIKYKMRMPLTERRFVEYHSPRTRVKSPNPSVRDNNFISNNTEIMSLKKRMNEMQLANCTVPGNAIDN